MTTEHVPKRQRYAYSERVPVAFTYIHTYVRTWNEASVLFSAPYSGNVELFDWLVQRFNLVPDELNAVSGCQWPDFILCSAC